MGNPAVAKRRAIREPRYPSRKNPTRLRKGIFSLFNIDRISCTCLTNGPLIENRLLSAVGSLCFCELVPVSVDGASRLTFRRHANNSWTLCFAPVDVPGLALLSGPHGFEEEPGPPI